MSIFGPPKEKRTQLHFRDDGKFTFRKMRIQDTFMVEKKGDDILKGWKHFFKLQFPFAGLPGNVMEFKRGIGSDMVTLGYDRDIILDPFGIVDEKEKPDKHKKINDNPWITDVAEGQRYKAQNQPGTRLLVEKLTLILGVCTIIIVLAIAGRAVWG